MRAKITLELNDDDLAEAYGCDPEMFMDDLADSLRARLTEVYVGDHAAEVRGTVAAVRLRPQEWGDS